MALDHRSGVLSLDRLGPPNLIETFGFLDRDPVLNVYLLALTLRDELAKPRDELWAARRDGEITSLLYLGGQSGAVLPLGEDPGALELMADQLVARLSELPRRFQIIGQRAGVRAMVSRLEREGVRPRLIRDQWYMAIDRGRIAPFDRLEALGRARREDYDLVYQSGALLRAEELDEDPRVSDPFGYAKRVEEECRDGYTHLWVDEEGLCFRASVSALTPEAAQVSGVFTPPTRRNRGLARRGLSELCSRLLERSAAVCLFVNDFNAPAISLYRRLGFETRSPWASAFYEGTGEPRTREVSA